MLSDHFADSIRPFLLAIRGAPLCRLYANRKAQPGFVKGPRAIKQLPVQPFTSERSGCFFVYR